MTSTIEPVPDRIDQQQLAQQLVEAARAEGVELVGPGGLLTGLTKTVLETAVEAEMTEHLGYDRHDRVGRDCGNSHNGTRTKTVLTEIGPSPPPTNWQRKECSSSAPSPAAHARSHVGALVCVRGQPSLRRRRASVTGRCWSMRRAGRRWT